MEKKLKEYLVVTATLIILTSYVDYVQGVPKIGTEHKVNLGWPNFFNPEIAILRKSTDKLAGNNSTSEDNESKQLVEGDGSIEDSSAEDVWKLLDYTIKGGLRGRYFVLNSTSCSNYIPVEIIDTLHEILEKEEVKEEYLDLSDEKRNSDAKTDECHTGEITENGLFLRTPMITRQYTESLGKFGALLTVAASSNPTSFIYYGNWCGRGGRSAPIDATDMCCLEFDKCYGRLVRDCPDILSKPYSTMYAWSLLQDTPICVRSESLCVNRVCECDRHAAMCILEGLHAHNIEFNTTATSEESSAMDESLTTLATYIDDQS